MKKQNKTKRNCKKYYKKQIKKKKATDCAGNK